ncbi:MAG: AAA family ATPase [Fibrobacterales bacterium]
MKIEVDITKNQTEVWGTLHHALVSGSFPQAILIEGKPGVGKKALALKLGTILKCTDPEVRPCGTCFNCQCAKKEEGPNFIWLPPIIKKSSSEDFNNPQHRNDAIRRVVPHFIENPYDISIISPKSYIGVPMVRELKGQLSYKDKENRVLFIPEADKMNKSATNALLKVLEEVPNNCYFILTTSSRATILPTILSRCLQVRVPSMDQDEMERVLAQFEYEVDDRELLCNLSNGAPGQAMALIAGDYKSIRKEALSYLKDAASGRFPQLLKQVQALKYDEEKSLSHCDFLYILLHDLFLIQSNDLAHSVRNSDIRDELSAIVESFPNQEAIQKAMSQVIHYRHRLFSNANPTFVLGSLGLDLV